MLFILDFIITILVIVGMYSLYKSIVLFFKILLLKEGKQYNGLFQSTFELYSIDNWYNGDFFNIFPISYFFYIIDKNSYNKEKQSIKELFLLKFKYEKILWILFLLGLLAIPISIIV